MYARSSDDMLDPTPKALGNGNHRASHHLGSFTLLPQYNIHFLIASDLFTH